MSDYARHSSGRPAPIGQPSPARVTQQAAAPHASPESQKLRQFKADLTDSPRVSRLEGLTAQLNDPRAVAQRIAPVVQRVIGPNGDGEYVREISTDEVYFAQYNGKGYYDLYQDDTHVMTAAPDDPDFGLAAELDAEKESSGSEQSLSEQQSDDEAMEQDVVPQLDPEQAYTFTFKLDPTVKKQVGERATAITTKRPPKYKPKADQPDYLDILYSVNQKAQTAKANKKYPTGSKAGEKLDQTYLSTPLSVRLDKIVNKKTSVNPRVSRKGKPDKTTQQLVGLIDAYEDEDQDDFLAGFRGEKFGKSMNKTAYGDGVEARATVLISDVVDYPGNSVITDRLLANVEDANDYIRLFTGSRTGEYSYGALPSQNRATLIEGSLERKAPFKNFGTLLSKGTLAVSSAASNVSTLRKMKSLVDADSTLVTITARTGKKRRKAEETTDISPDHFSNYVAAKAMESRDVKSATAQNEGLNIFSDAEDNTDDEAERISVLGDEQLQTRTEDMERQLEILKRKLKAAKSVDKKRKRDEF